MPHDVPPVLTALADLYRKSVAGTRGGARDFICDYEQLLRHAGCHDGDEREKAEADLMRAELESDGLLTIDRAARSGIFLGVRISKSGGEEWLFGKIGMNSPGSRRMELAEFFREMASAPLPDDWRVRWRM